MEVVSLESVPLKEKTMCYFCHGTENLVMCHGGCNRSYHLRCIGGKAKKDMNTWKCRACSGKDLSSSTFHKKHCLRNWYFKEAVELPNNSFSILIEGSLCSDGSMWRCSPIDHLLDSTHFVTTNQSIYTLIVFVYLKMIIRVIWIFKKVFKMGFQRSRVIHVRMDCL